MATTQEAELSYSSRLQGSPADRTLMKYDGEAARELQPEPLPAARARGDSRGTNMVAPAESADPFPADAVPSLGFSSTGEGLPPVPNRPVRRCVAPVPRTEPHARGDGL